MLFSFSLEDSYDDTNNGINSAISYAIENKVKELELDIVGKENSEFYAIQNKVEGLMLNIFRKEKFKFKAHYNLPKKVLAAQSITVLKLKGFMLEPPQNLTLNYPSIKELNLENCNGMHTLKVYFS